MIRRNELQEQPAAATFVEDLVRKVLVLTRVSERLTSLKTEIEGGWWSLGLGPSKKGDATKWCSVTSDVSKFVKVFIWEQIRTDTYGAQGGLKITAPGKWTDALFRGRLCRLARCWCCACQQKHMPIRKEDVRISRGRCHNLNEVFEQTVWCDVWWEDEKSTLKSWLMKKMEENNVQTCGCCGAERSKD